MELAVPYALLADAVLVLHVAVVLFVVSGLVLVVAGNLLTGLGLGQCAVVPAAASGDHCLCGGTGPGPGWSAP
jgi:hypothetical protein